MTGKSTWYNQHPNSGSLLSLTPVSKDLTPSSDLHGYQACSAVYIHTSKQHNKYLKNEVELEQSHALFLWTSYDCFGAGRTELSGCFRTCGPPKHKIFTVCISAEFANHWYKGNSSRTLWPLLGYRPDRSLSGACILTFTHKCCLNHRPGGEV